MPEGLELLVGLVRTPNYRVVSANTLQPHIIHLQTASQTHGITAPATDTSSYIVKFIAWHELSLIVWEPDPLLCRNIIGVVVHYIEECFEFTLF